MTTSTLGALAALGSSCTWAYASTRYAQASRDVGSFRVNLARASVVLPIYAAIVLFSRGAHALDGVTAPRASWLVVSVLCSYGAADALFFTAARRLGISTALSIASVYPLWAATAGALVRGEPFGLARAAGTLLCVGGVVALVRLHVTRGDADRKGDALGVLLALVTSFLWAGNSFSIKEASSTGAIDVWQVNVVRYAIALTLLAAIVAGSRTPPPLPRPARGWPALLPAILADALLGSTIYVYGLAHTDLAIGATLSSLAPLVSVPFAIWLGEERWSAARFAAITATVGGVAILVSF